MTYTLAIGDRTYSSWSLRGWLMFAKFGIPVTLREGRLYTDQIPQMLADFGGARMVPAVTHSDGLVVWDSLAIAETLAERHPEAGHWPQDPAARALARSICAEMHSGFQALRNACPMNLHHLWLGFVETPPMRKDLDRIELLWRSIRQTYGSTGPWLFGRYSAADAYFAPVAARVAAYALKVSPVSQAYVAAHLADPAFLQWRRDGLAAFFEQPSYEMHLPHGDWPGLV